MSRDKLLLAQDLTKKWVQGMYRFPEVKEEYTIQDYIYYLDLYIFHKVVSCVVCLKVEYIKRYRQSMRCANCKWKQEPTKKPCVDCSTTFIAPAGHSVRCKDCQKKRNRELKRVWMSKSRKDVHIDRK